MAALNTIAQGASYIWTLLADNSGVPLNFPALARQGKCFSANFNFTSGSAAAFPLSVFNPANSGKTVELFRAVGTDTSGQAITMYLQKTTTDPAFATTITPSNRLAGGAASVTSCTATTTAQTTPSTNLLSVFSISVSAVINEAISQTATYVLPAGSANGLTMFMSVPTTDLVSIFMEWAEF